MWLKIVGLVLVIVSPSWSKGKYHSFYVPPWIVFMSQKFYVILFLFAVQTCEGFDESLHHIFISVHPACSVGELSTKTQSCSVKMFMDIADIIQEECK